MRKRLVLSNTVIAAVGFLAAFLLVALMVQEQYKSEFAKRLDATLAVMATQGESIRENPQRFAVVENTYLKEAGQEMRVTILDLNGDVIGDSEQNSEEDDDSIGENHWNRPEIQQALKEGKGYDIRRSESVGEPYYYAALYLPGQCFLRAAIPITNLQDIIFQLWIYVFLCALLGIVLVCAVTWITMRRFMEPLSKLTSAARRIAGGDFTGRVEGKYKDEIGELAFSFNMMAGNTENAVLKLQEKQEQLEGVLQGMDDGVIAADGENKILFLNERARSLLDCPGLLEGMPLDGNLLVRKIVSFMKEAAEKDEAVRGNVSESGRNERQFTVYAAPVSRRPGAVLAVIADVTRMRRLEQMRSEFVANVTHELKTPLTSIRGSIELLKSSDRDEETRRYFYDVLDIEAERLHHLIDDMLVLSQIENAKEDPSIRRCNLKEELEKTAARLLAAAEKEGVSLELDIDPTVFVDCSPTRLQQLFGNLMENAVKYNVPQGKVFVTGQRQRQMAVVKVKDTGIGIAPEHIPRLFERFYRVDTSRSREIGGTGLGLSIVKHLAALYHGEVSVESEPGAGTVFTVRLPLSMQEFPVK